MIARINHVCISVCSRPAIHRLIEAVTSLLSFGGHGPLDGHHHFGAF